jgi:YbbR domain-containing protein
MSTIRWLVRNVSTLLLSFILAVTVWASAVVTADPNQEELFGPAPIEQLGQAADLVITNEIPDQAILTIKAPRSIWDQLKNNPGKVKVWIDLTGLAAGEHTVVVNTKVDLSPLRIIKVEPAVIDLILEQLTTKIMPVDLQVIGEPPLGYRKASPDITPGQVTVTGPASAVERVNKISASLDMTGASQSVKAVVPVRAVDANGALVSDVVLTPKEVIIHQPISIMGGYKNVAVKVMTTGQVASGYRLTNISVTPPTVTVYSTDPQLVNELPGYVETIPVDLTGLTDDTEFNVAINLPPGISLVSEPSVLVQIGVAAIEGSLKLTVPVESLGLSPTLKAIISPATVDIIVNGPLPVLDTLSPASFRAVVDLTNLPEGTYQIEPKLDLIPQAVQIQAILPETVEVVIVLAPTETPTQPATSTPRVVIPPLATPAPTRKP